MQCGEAGGSTVSFPDTGRAVSAKQREYKWQGGSEMSRCAARLARRLSLRTQKLEQVFLLARSQEVQKPYLCYINTKRNLLTKLKSSQTRTPSRKKAPLSKCHRLISRKLLIPLLNYVQPVLVTPPRMLNSLISQVSTDGLNIVMRDIKTTQRVREFS